eukprot:TRINITY_DN2388_c0_g1_i3.p1 TRINITY_DN2388_c0_g1~~TRINITY_DN2388_c0_g1_i3.p1  ORF type:complete len:931 (-),score=119.16 TRINITY_DN2388_c0_g1_i3:351-3143(-)
MHHMYTRFLAASACWLLGLSCFAVIGPTPFNDKCSHYEITGYTGCFTWPQFWGSLALLGFGFGFVACASWAAVAAAGFAREVQGLHGQGHAPSLAVIIVLSAVSLISAVLSAVLLMKPFDAYQTTSEGERFSFPEGWTIDVWNVVLGYFATLALGPLGIALARMAMLIISEPAARLPTTGRESELAPTLPASTTPETTLLNDGAAPTSAGYQAMISEPEKLTVPLVLSIVFFCFCFLVTTIVTPIWNFSQNSYMLKGSEYSWFFLPLGGVPATNDADKTGVVDREKCLAHGQQCPWFTFKVFTDTTVFYLALLMMVVVGFALRNRKGDALRRRYPIKIGGQFSHGTTGFEAIALSSLLLLAIFWAVYWFCIYGRFWEKDLVEDLWPMTGPYDDPKVEKTFAFWYQASFGAGPLPPIPDSSRPWDQDFRPEGTDYDNKPPCSLYHNASAACGSISYCFYDSKEVKCKLAKCTDMKSETSTCSASDWCRVEDGLCLPKYEGLDSERETGRGVFHVICRASGHMASLFMSLVILTSVKSSPLLRAMGLSWEEVLPFHRILGCIAFSAVTLHMLFWWVKWILDGTFWANVFPDTNYWIWITPTWNHLEDFAVMMAQYSYVLFAAMMAAVPFRREYYRVFYLLHHGAIWMAMMGICHAWAFHYFVLPGILLWWWDRLVRLVQAAEPTTVTKFESLKSGVVHLEIRAPHFAKRFRAPNYGFVRVPGVACAGWHPFTVNVVDDRVTFLIKESGPWTKDLAQLAKKGVDAAAGATLFGPFGGVSSRFFPAASPLVLFAGGIGVTPVASVFSEAVFARMLTGVYFIWIVQGVDLLELPYVSDLVERARGRNGCQVRLFVTRGKPADVQAWQEKQTPCENVKVTGGRPDMLAIFDEVDAAGRAPGTGAVFACGPDVMQKEAMELGKQRKYEENHVETFLF